MIDALADILRSALAEQQPGVVLSQTACREIVILLLVRLKQIEPEAAKEVARAVRRNSIPVGSLDCQIILGEIVDQAILSHCSDKSA